MESNLSFDFDMEENGEVIDNIHSADECDVFFGMKSLKKYDWESLIF